MGVWRSNRARASSKFGITAPVSIYSWMFSKFGSRLSKRMIIKTRSIFDSEVSILEDFGKIDTSSSLRVDIRPPYEDISILSCFKLAMEDITQ